MPALGRIIGGKYRLLHMLGRGGMGTVWLAEHLDLDAHVAIKFIDEAVADDWRAHERFSREARACAALRSPHVVQILDQGVADQNLYLVMEHLTGESLAARLLREPQLRPSVTAQVVQHVCRALTRAHGLGIVHRDIKPANAFLVEEEDSFVVKVLDFGVAKVLHDPDRIETALTDHGAFLGTLEYIAPEHFEGAPASPANDLWATAVMAFECLLGFRPYSGKNLAELIRNVCTEEVVPSRFADVAPGFDAWFRRATDRDPTRRFGSARELASSLRDVLAAGPDVVFPLLSAGLARQPKPRSSVAAYSASYEPHLRSTERIVTSIPAGIDGRRDAKHIALIVDISESGAQLWTRKQLERGQTIQLAIHFDDETNGVTTEAEVVRVSAMEAGASTLWKFAVGVRFASRLIGLEAQFAKLREASDEFQRQRGESGTLT